ncbi:hypothetical protein Aca07nite_01350 [Actinoplanes capillaceus]|uniref:Uncharacterized protein n=1 Tax=Actinoplanes campanulatus TaxID=113559 RepID=A0ABQ3WB78_9ACTN|nr:hypothetical protein [Actinoplanes capillaceus]GID42860.1 hypothetical protein Aca07nite_01350 [Actinoplanes capillaceus]
MKSSILGGGTWDGLFQERGTRLPAGHVAQPTEPETVVVCLRFEASAAATWSRTSGVRARFHEIDCP